MDDAYEAVSVHGVMPLVIDRETGVLRFARIGEDRPDECVVSPEGLPEAEIDLFVFSGSDKLAVWSSAIREIANNAVEVIVPEVSWPRFALLVRHDRAARQGNTLEEAVALRDPHGKPVASAARKAGREARGHAAKMHAAAMAREAFRREWMDELASLSLVPEVEDVSGEAGEIAFGMTFGDGIRGIGPTYSLRRDGGGYAVRWRLGVLRMDEAAAGRVDEAAAEIGARRDGAVVHVGLQELDRSSLARLAEIDAALVEAASRETSHAIR